MIIDGQAKNRLNGTRIHSHVIHVKILLKMLIVVTLCLLRSVPWSDSGTIPRCEDSLHALRRLLCLGPGLAERWASVPGMNFLGSKFMPQNVVLENQHPWIMGMRFP